MKYLILLFLQLITCKIINIKPLSVTRYYFSSTSLQSRGLAFFAGGLTSPDYNVYGNVDIFDAVTNSWQTAQLSIPRYFIAATSIDKHNIAFFAGGTTSIFGSFTDRIDIFDANTNKWLIGSLSVARSFLAATSLKELAFFAGGVNFQEVSTIDIYNATSQTWFVANLSIARDSLAATSLEYHGLAFFAGGDGFYGQTFSQVDIFNSKTQQWFIGQLSVNRTYLAATSLPYQGLVFFGGGTLFQYGNIITNVVDIYDANLDVWTTAELSEPRQMLSATSLPGHGLVFFGGGFIYILGYSFINIPIETIDVYNATNKTWQTTKFLREFQTSSATYLEKYSLAFFGGYDKTTMTSPIYVFSNCPAGYFNNTITTETLRCDACGAGSYANVGATQCLICPQGYYCEFAFANPLPSFPGCFAPNPGNFYQCEYICEPGFYCKNGSISQTICPQGHYCDQYKMGTPTSCQSGTYNQNSGSTSQNACQVCPAGTYCNSNHSATNIVPCPAQYYCPIGTTNYMACPGGYYCPFATNNLISCPSGSYCPELSSVPVSCPSGFYCPSLTTSPIGCQAGWQCPAGSVRPLICPKGTYSLSESGDCTQCKSGEFTHGPGSSTCIECPVSRIDFDGWHCMNDAQRLVFAGGWTLSIVSICLSIWKIHRWVRHRRKKLMEYGVIITWRNIFFYKRPKNEVALIERSFFDDADRMRYLEQMIYDLKNDVEKLKTILR